MRHRYRVLISRTRVCPSTHFRHVLILTIRDLPIASSLHASSLLATFFTRRIYLAKMMLKSIFVLIPFAVAFQTALPQRLTAAQHRRGARPFYATSNGDLETWKAQREQAKAALERMDTLESSIRDGEDSPLELKEELEQVEQAVSQLTAELLPPSGLSLADYNVAIKKYLSLPLSLRLALCQVLEIPEAAEDWTRSPEIVAKLYERRRKLTSERLQDAVKNVQRRMEGIPVLEQETDAFIQGLLDDMSVEEAQREGYAKELLPRVTRNDERQATPEQLEVLMNVLGKSTFTPSGKPESIPGGYVIRGRNTLRSGRELIEILDSRLPTQWNAQVSILPELQVDEDSATSGDSVLLLLNSDFSPTTSRILLSFSTAAALVTSFLFAVGCFGANENVAQHMQDLVAAGDYSGVNWFNGELAQVLLPLGFIQIMHELGHFLVALRDKIKTAPPTLLPFWFLPYLGAKTEIKTSPRDMTSLFDFAFMGPFLGLFTSAIFLCTGLQSTLLADAATSQYFPAIPVSLLQLSTLGGSIVDYFFGGTGIITSQDPSNTLLLHPFALAGFAGIMLHSLELLPLGSTDGGRLSQALFGRQAHSIIGGAVWISLLASSFLSSDGNQDVLLGVWAVYNIVQNDMEVPCRNEVDPVNIPRSLAAFGLWFIAILAITPMTL